MGSNGSKSRINNKKKNSIELLEDEIRLLVENTHFTRDEILDWHRGFIKDCPKGKLDKKKFIEIYKQFYPLGKADKFCGHVFKTFDTDHSNSIDFVEFLIAISITSHGDIREKLKMAFKMYDIDSNGKIDRKEMEKIIESIYDLLGEDNRKGDKAPSERVKKIMSKLDTNNDGFISCDEFVNGCLEDEFMKKLLAPNAN